MSSTQGERVWPQLLKLYWGSVAVLGTAAFAAELALGGPASILAGATFLISVAVGYLAGRRWPRASVTAHLLFAELSSIWLSHQPSQSIAPGWEPGLTAYAGAVLITLAIYALGAFGGPWGAVPGLLGAIALFPHASLQAAVVISPLWAVAGAVGYGVFVLNNRLGAAYAQLEEMAYTDPLTGLGNRQALNAEYRRLSDICEREEKPLLLSLWDVDGLKQINDTAGHEAGDERIKEFARALSTGVRQTDALFRTGGDEFCGLHPGLEAGEALAARVKELFPQVSVGFSPAAGGDLDAALAAADALMYSEKQLKRDFDSLA